MRRTTWAAAVLVGVAVMVMGLSGCATVDRLLYQQSVTYTNRVIERVVTNAVALTNVEVQILERVRVVTETNASGVAVGMVYRDAIATNLVCSIVTNYVPVVVRTTEVIAVTNLVDRPGVLASIECLPNAVDSAVPGLGSLLALVLGGAYHMYRQMRNKQVTAALVQGVETARAVLTTTPQGMAADAELVAWLKDHQRAAGVLGTVTAAVEATADNPAALAAAAEIAGRVKRAV